MNPVAAPLSVSIAMATYNGEKYIGEQLASLEAQTFAPTEIIITDDGSTDRTLEIVEVFSQSSSISVKVFKNANRLGYSENFFKAASLCSADFIAFCDQDDVWMKSKLESCMSEFGDPEVLLCVHSSKVWTKLQIDHRRPDFKRRRVLSPNSIDPLTVHPGFCMVIRKSLLGIIDCKNRPRDIYSLYTNASPMVHDQWVWFLSSIFGKIVCLQSTLALWRQHDGNTCGAGDRASIFRAVMLSVNALRYDRLATHSFECASFLRHSAPSLTPELRGRCLTAASRFEARGRFLLLRAGIYDFGTNLPRRLVAFLTIAVSGGYFEDSAKSRLGLRAGAKDCLFGITGLYKFIGPNID